MALLLALAPGPAAGTSLAVHVGADHQVRGEEPLSPAGTTPFNLTLSLTPNEGDAPLAVEAIAHTEGAIPPVTYTFNWADGSPTTTSTNGTARHWFSYGAAGSIPVSVSATTAQGTVVASARLSLNPAVGVAISTTGSTWGRGSLAATYTALAGGGDPPYTVTWYWGDASSPTVDHLSIGTTSVSEAHDYVINGSVPAGGDSVFVLTVAISDADGGGNSSSLRIQVNSTQVAKGPAGLSTLDEALLGVGIGAGLALAVVLIFFRRRLTGARRPRKPSPGDAEAPAASETKPVPATSEVEAGPETDVPAPAAATMAVAEPTVAPAAEALDTGPNPTLPSPSLEAPESPEAPVPLPMPKPATPTPCPLCGTPLPGPDAPCPTCTPSLVPAENLPPPEPLLEHAPPLPGATAPLDTRRVALRPPEDLPAPSAPPAAESGPPANPAGFLFPVSPKSLYENLVAGSAAAPAASTPPPSTGASSGTPAPPPPARNLPCMICGGALAPGRYCPACKITWNE